MNFINKYINIFFYLKNIHKYRMIFFCKHHVWNLIKIWNKFYHYHFTSFFQITFKGISEYNFFLFLHFIIYRVHVFIFEIMHEKIWAACKMAYQLAFFYRLVTITLTSVTDIFRSLFWNGHIKHILFWHIQNQDFHNVVLYVQKKKNLMQFIQKHHYGYMWSQYGEIPSCMHLVDHPIFTI